MSTCLQSVGETCLLNKKSHYLHYLQFHHHPYKLRYLWFNLPLRCVKGGANTMWALLTFLKYKTTNYGVRVMKRYSWNIFQWNQNKTKSTKLTQWRIIVIRQYLNIGLIWITYFQGAVNVRYSSINKYPNLPCELLCFF